MKRMLLILAAVSLSVVISSCEHGDIFDSVRCEITLDAGNTYLAGEEVVFNIDNAADNIIFYSGETSHEYQYRDRYSVLLKDVEYATLYLSIQHRLGPGNEDLEIYYTDRFDGISGTDGEADSEMVRTMYENGMEGWHRFPYEDGGRELDVYYDFEDDVTSCISNFCIGFYWKPIDDTYPGKYFIIGTVDVKIIGEDETRSYSVSSLLGQVIMMQPYEGSYYYHDDGVGSFYLTNSGGIDLQLNGGNGDSITHNCEGWVFTSPFALNTVTADSPEVVKNLESETNSFSYVYESAGTYTATFVSSNDNYMGSDRKIQEFTITISDGADSGDSETE